MSKRITTEEALRKRQHELDVLSKLKEGKYRSTRLERRKEKRLRNELTWFQYIKSRGGIKEKKEEK